MTLGYIGLGKMGKNMVLRLHEKGHHIIAWNRSPEPRQEVAAAGVEVAEDVATVVSRLPAPKCVWVMLPAGQATQDMLTQLASLLSAGDLVIDGSNSFYKETQKRAALLAEKQIRFMDVGVSGGPAGARNGACLMIGGQQADFLETKELMHDIAAPDAVQFFEGHGAGHFVKMVHNGIEYGMMQAIAEGFAVMKASPFSLNLTDVATIYNRGSVIESRLIGWLKTGFEQYTQEMPDISGSIAHTGEGQWTTETAKELDVPVPVIQASFDFRVVSAQHPSYTGKIVSLLRNQFGGHHVSAKK